jgi:hypothetical protein
MNNTLFQRNGESHVRYGKKQCATGRSVLHIVSLCLVTFQKEYCLALRVFKCEEHHHCAK